VARKYAQVWLSRYPWPERCVQDNGGDFFGPEFQFLLQGCKIKDAPTSNKNPQAHANCERMHQTVGNAPQTFLHGEPPRDVPKAKDFIDEALLIATHAMQTGIHTNLGSSPGNLVFNRDMFLRVVYCFDTGSLASIGIDIPYTGTGWSVFRLVFLGVSKILADVMV
jgi:hypothetical protein